MLNCRLFLPAKLLTSRFLLPIISSRQIIDESILCIILCIRYGKAHCREVPRGQCFGACRHLLPANRHWFIARTVDYQRLCGDTNFMAPNNGSDCVVSYLDRSEKISLAAFDLHPRSASASIIFHVEVEATWKQVPRVAPVPLEIFSSLKVRSTCKC